LSDVPSPLLASAGESEKSQHPRLTEAGRAPCVPAPAPAAPLRAGCPGPWPGSFWRAPGRRPHSLWAACASAPSPAPGVQREPPGLQFTACYADTGCHWKGPVQLPELYLLRSFLV